MMNHIYAIEGMTCEGCAASVKNKLSKVGGVDCVEVDLEQATAEITIKSHIPLEIFQEALPTKYGIQTTGSHSEETVIASVGKSKFQQLKPLFLIFAYLFAAAFLLNYQNWNVQKAMLDFMGLFYIVFSFFKFLDLKGFPKSFRMYDPLAKAIGVYGWIYPFVELALGLMFLMRFEVHIALIVTVVILGITTFGVVKTLLDKKSIRCACLGTALNLPMTEATFIENAIMLIMAFLMIF